MSSPTLKTRKKSRTSLNGVPTHKGKFGSIFKKASSEFNLFFLRIKSLGEEVFSENQVINEFFDDFGSDSDSLLERLERSGKGYNINEERFLISYKKFKSLDKMHQHYKQSASNEDMKSSSTMYSDGNGARFNLKDVIQESYASELAQLEIGADSDVEGDENEQDDETLGNKSSSSDKINFVDLDVPKMREELEKDEGVDSSTNIGEVLWEYRRSKWVKNTKGQVKNQVNNSRLLFDQIPKESYVKVYTTLVDKGRPLKSDRRINLYDLMKLINAGWAAEEKWERAAKGMP